MKLSRSHFLLIPVLAALVVGTACERHPVSQTIPDYEQQQVAEQKKAEEKKLAPAQHALKFFHEEKTSDATNAE